MSYLHVDAVIRRAIQLGVIRVDHQLPNQLDRGYVQGLKETAALLERIRHGLTIRKMMYDHADICQASLEDQLKLHPSKERGLKHERYQRKGLKKLDLAARDLPAEQPDGLHNPNIIVNCDSGTDGELGCEPGYIKVYQAVFCASYGANGYKDVIEENVKGTNKIVIHPAAGGKCNVSIGNPFRSMGWYLNYMNQGAPAPIIRMWEIPSKYFINNLLRYCGTEKQVKDKAKKDEFFVEMCDHRASNQFGIWTHHEVKTPNVYDTEGNPVRTGLAPTKVGAEFMAHSRRLVTYYDPRKSHVPCKRDGEARDVRRLMEHLAIPTHLTDRFHDFGMSLSDASGNLTMNAEAAANDQRLLQVIELIQSEDAQVLGRVARLDKALVRPFANLLSYNNLNPQRFNTSSHFTRTGLDIKNLRRETLFMAKVYKGTQWHRSVRSVVTALLRTMDQQALLPADIKASLHTMFFAAKTYKDVLSTILAKLGSVKNNSHIIDALNGILRPLCGGSTVLGLARHATAHQNFQVSLLGDLRFEIGKSHRVELKGHEGVMDPLDGHKGGGFVPLKGFTRPLGDSIKTSNTAAQLNLHDPLVSRMQEQGIPMVGGISGTTRDIFATLHSVFAADGTHDHWQFFSVVAAFMIKHHYHSLVECFIAAYQLRKTGAAVLACSTVEDFYRVVQTLTNVTLLEED